MRLSDIAIENLKRRKGKTFFMLVGLLVAVATVVTLVTVTGTMEEDISKKLDEYGANIIVMPQSEGLSLSYGGMSLGDMSIENNDFPQTDIAKIREIKNSNNISIVAPKLFGVIETKGVRAALAGVDFEEELRLKRWWRKSADGGFEKKEKPVSADHMADDKMNEMPVLISDLRKVNSAIIGHEVAKKLGIAQGDEIQAMDSSLYASVILEQTGSQDDMMIFTALPFVQKLFGKESRISLVEISAYCYNCPIDDIVTQISGTVPNSRVRALKEVVTSRMETLGHFRNFAVGISGIVIFIGILLVFVTMMGSVNERKKEIGIFRAIGFQQRNIMSIILMEAVIMGSISGAAGYVTGISVSYMVLALLKDITAVAFRFDFFLASGSVLVSVLAGVAASYYPARKASKLDPSIALKSI